MSDQYSSLSAEIRECAKCVLCSVRTNVVVDRGDPTAKFLLIGEAPGANEDATGSAFVGRAGAELDSLLKDAGVDKFLIINVIKCRPTDNKFPGDTGAYQPETVVAQCLPWLDRQIALVQPKVVVLVGGKAAAYTVFRHTKMPPVREIVGKKLLTNDYQDTPFFGMYHTSYLLRLRNIDRREYDRVREQTVELLRTAWKECESR